MLVPGTVQLHERVDDLRDARARIIAAADAERRRIERDLHDGAQQHLVALSINLRLAQELVEGDPRAAHELLTEVQGQAADALATLRDLARGIYPPALADRGIAAALEAHLAKSHHASVLEVQPPGTHARFAPEVEAAVYFCVLEALQNCAKHAPEAALRVRLQVEADRVSFVVADDGQGFDPGLVRTGSGMRGMHDRMAAVGGNLDVQSAPGDGTTVAGSLPVTAFKSPSLATAPAA
jgi:signal transduction histidine kinase